MTIATEPMVRFERGYTPEPSCGCWLWLGNTGWTGYGAFRIDPKSNSIPAHRASWKLHRGDIPSGLFVCHTCDNRACVNPDHLFLGTPSENMQDASRKGRMNWKAGEVRALRKGEDHPASKLKKSDVLDIRSSSLLGTELADKYGVSNNTISRIRRGLIWRHV